MKWQYGFKTPSKSVVTFYLNRCMTFDIKRRYMLNGEHIKYEVIFIIGCSTPNWVKTSSDHIPKLSKIHSSLLLLYIIQMESCCTAIFPPAIIIKHYKKCFCGAIWLQLLWKLGAGFSVCFISIAKVEVLKFKDWQFRVFLVYNKSV